MSASVSGSWWRVEASCTLWIMKEWRKQCGPLCSSRRTHRGVTRPWRRWSRGSFNPLPQQHQPVSGGGGSTGQHRTGNGPHTQARLVPHTRPAQLGVQMEDQTSAWNRHDTTGTSRLFHQQAGPPPLCSLQPIHTHTHTHPPVREASFSWH